MYLRVAGLRSEHHSSRATIHTNPGCTIASSSSSALAISGSVVGGTNCAAAESGNQGCGMRSPDNTSFGTGFNENNGGVYASTLLPINHDYTKHC